MIRRLYEGLYPGISFRVMAPFLLVILAVAAVGVFIVTRLVAGSIEERLNNQLVDSAQAASNAVVEQERQQLETLRLMAFTTGVAEALTENDSDRLYELIQPVAANAVVDRVLIFDDRGNGVFFLNRVRGAQFDQYSSLVSPDLTAWQGVQRIVNLDSDRLGDKFIDIITESDGNVVFYISAPVLNEDREQIGGMSIGINAANLAFRVSEQSLSAITLYEQDGQILASTLRGIDDSQIALSEARTQQLLQDVETFSPIEQVFYNQNSHQVLYAPLEIRSQQVGLMAAALPKSFVAERIGTSRNFFAGLFSASFVGIAILGMLVSRSITNPVRQLVVAARAIREGDLSKRVNLTIPDELGELGISFDHMTEALIEQNIEVNKLYESQLQETARLDSILSSISDSVFVFDTNNSEMLRNASGNELVRDLRKNDPTQYARFRQLCQHPETLPVGQTITLAGKIFSIFAMPVRMQSGELLGHVIVFRDITDIFEAERIKDDIIQQLSHELRTPLTAARGYIDIIRMLGENQTAEKTEQFLESATKQLLVLQQMINQVIDVSVLASSELKLDIGELDLGKLVGEILHEHDDEIEARGLQLTISIPAEPVLMDGDYSKLRRVVEELLKNAMNFNRPDGGIEITLCSENQHRCVLTVIDTGVGIKEEEEEKIFERMYRGSAAEAGPTDTRGLGLGLFFVREIVNAHQGEISLESGIFGTTFTVNLPTHQR
jgi:two-component system sensor histidine kinase VicK